MEHGKKHDICSDAAYLTNVFTSELPWVREVGGIPFITHEHGLIISPDGLLYNVDHSQHQVALVGPREQRVFSAPKSQKGITL